LLNHGCTAAFALSSGTIGAALSSALSKVRSIALSYGTVVHPVPLNFYDPAHKLGANIIQHLWNNWDQDIDGLRNGEVDLYSINIPMVEGLLSPDGLKIFSTTMWRNSYGRLFKRIPDTEQTIPSMGPDPLDSEEMKDGNRTQDLVLKFGPEMKGLINPTLSSLPVGSDGWALHQGSVSVTPLRACYGAPPEEKGSDDAEDRLWKMKL
jgi:tubulin--tyrosine ligase